MRSRDDFGKLVNLFYNTGVGAEIGVDRGQNAFQIAQHWPGKIILVDIWPDKENLEYTRELLNEERFLFYRLPSIEAAKLIPHGSLDWVYIDADHHHESVLADLRAWYGKVRLGGVIAGHDYCDLEEDVHKGVIEAVDEFAKEMNYRVSLTDLDYFKGKTYPTWWFVKGRE